ncbi:MAG: hypothetical protein KKF65_04810 [Nanoarchaeota archaeon]|nr:hypothetical protein [Nanoarchaeota archaeon]
MKKNEYIGWDLTGCIISPETISTKSGLEVSLNDFPKPKHLNDNLDVIRSNAIKQSLKGEFGEDVNVHWKRLLDSFVEDYVRTSKSQGEDLALAKFLWSIDNNYGVSFENYEIGTKNLFESGFVRTEVLDAMAELNSLGKKNIIVTKNDIKDVGGFVNVVNKHYGGTIIDNYTGSMMSSCISDIFSGRDLMIMADQTGELYVEGIPFGITRMLKKDAVKKILGKGVLTGFVTDNGDKNIREDVIKNGGSVVIIKNEIPYELLDHYFQLTADQTGNYQQKTLADGVYNDVLKYDSRLTEELVKILA